MSDAAGLLRRVMPRTRLGDYAFSLAIFLAKHRRFPKRSGGGLNDVLFRIKTSDEILAPLRVFVSDKEHVKQYVTAKAGPQHNVPTLALLRTPEAAELFEYPSDCVIKPTHLSGEVIFRRNGSAVDRGRIRRWFSANQYDVGRGANYRGLRPKVIVEPILFGSTNNQDFKIHCVLGVPKLIQVDSDRQSDHHRNFYTPAWDFLPFSLLYPLGKASAAPPNLRELLSLARALSADFSFIRVDLYTDGNAIFVGELTNCPGNGNEPFSSSEGEALAAKLLFGDSR
jgi:hypothetical protein